MNRLAIPFPQKAQNPAKIAQEVSEKKTFKNYTFLYVYIARWQWQITLKGQSFDCS